MSRMKQSPVDVTLELSSLKYPAKQNRSLPELPPNVTVQKRPINHAPSASPFAGATVQKVVYVSRKTPVISAVKRVKAFLKQIEKRAMQSANIDKVLDKAGSRRVNDTGDQLHRKLEEASVKLQQNPEAVLVMASGRAIEQALRVAEWFRNRENEILTNVEVRTGSTSVIDDLIEKDDDDQEDLNADVERDDEGPMDVVMDGETTLEIQEQVRKQIEAAEAKQKGDDDEDTSVRQKRRRRRKRKQYDVEDVPEARIRWVKTIEIAITLRA